MVKKITVKNLADVNNDVLQTLNKISIHFSHFFIVPWLSSLLIITEKTICGKHKIAPWLRKSYPSLYRKNLSYLWFIKIKRTLNSLPGTERHITTKSTKDTKDGIWSAVADLNTLLDMQSRFNVFSALDCSNQPMNKAWNMSCITLVYRSKYNIHYQSNTKEWNWTAVIELMCW